MAQPISPDPLNLMLGKGAIYFDRFEGGNRTGEVHLGNCEVFSIATEDTKLEKYSSMDAEAGLLRSVTQRRKVTLNIQGDEFNPYNMALAFMGEEGTLSQSTDTVTDEVLTSSPKKGRWYPLVNRNVSSVVVTQDAGALVDGTDYEVDAVRGRIYLIPTGAATEGSTAADEITVDYSAGTVSLQQVLGATQSIIEGFLRFIGDPSAGPITEVEVWKASITPGGETGLISDDWGSWQLTLDIQKDSANNPTMPYYRQIFNGNT
jgi:hypothetical protein